MPDGVEERMSLGDIGAQDLVRRVACCLTDYQLCFDAALAELGMLISLNYFLIGL